MTRRDISPPRGGTPPPAVSRDVRGREIELRPLAVEICRRYRKEFPDEEERYGEAGNAWCVHDNLHILNWAFLETAHVSVLDHQVRWLGRVLAAREFPVERLARDLELAADVVRTEHPDVAAALERATASVGVPL